MSFQNAGLTPRQEESIRESTKRLNIWVGSVRAGKTVASLVRWLTFLSHPNCPRGKKLMVGKTMDTLRRNVLEPLGPDIEVRGNRAWIFGHAVDLVSAHHETSERVIRGITLAGAYGDEVTTWPENFWVMLLSRMSVAGAKGFFTTNPDSPRHWLKRNYLDRADKLDLYHAHFTIRDNIFLPPGFIEQLEAEYTGLWRKRFIDGLWVMAEGAIWDNFDSDRVVTLRGAQPMPLHRVWASVDYGTGAPFVLLIMGLGDDRRIHVIKEWRWDSVRKGRQMADVEYSVEVRKLCAEYGVEWLYIPPDAASFITQLYKDGFRTVRPAVNDVDDGLREVSNLFSEEWDALRITPDAEDTIGEIQGYVWDPGLAASGLDVPLKKDDHGCDALRYGVVSSKWLWRTMIRPRMHTNVAA